MINFIPIESYQYQAIFHFLSTMIEEKLTHWWHPHRVIEIDGDEQKVSEADLDLDQMAPSPKFV